MALHLWLCIFVVCTSSKINKFKKKNTFGLISTRNSKVIGNTLKKVPLKFLISWPPEYDLDIS